MQDSYIQRILLDNITEEVFDSFFDIVEEFLESVEPEDIVNTLGSLFDSFIFEGTGDYLLDNDTNTKACAYVNAYTYIHHIMCWECIHVASCPVYSFCM